MNSIGFNFTKILAHKNPDIKLGKGITTSIEYRDIRKEKVDIFKDREVLNFLFSFLIIYQGQDGKEKHGELSFEGNMLFSVTPDESKEVLKLWKKKQIPKQFNIALSNFVLRKCSIKALQLQEELNLPQYPELPSLRPKEE